ncbi:MAG: hypothetical protein ACI8ZB_005297, partial [Desulforhopalus sp.]
RSVALIEKSFGKDISLLLPRACSTMDKIVDRCAITIYPYSLCREGGLQAEGGMIIGFKVT